jgi:hypothetical protein
MLGETVDAQTGDRYGLASQLVNDDELDVAVAGRTARGRPSTCVPADQKRATTGA